jgi:hypothetical protein
MLFPRELDTASLIYEAYNDARKLKETKICSKMQKYLKCKHIYYHFPRQMHLRALQLHQQVLVHAPASKYQSSLPF